ncbi:restriction endonuclease subunit S [Paenibacillus sabinae]|uniref:Type I restriction modification DNA specificity domain-containing protein n=1 Tax=Paenibacillus sabinae T27 TaxID=1268072 RepID=X4ZK44_9BACL|nr:restriction endonuclease subunit S [Paenibacillus sabinae]AHV97075.1 hypothetical protein PSAB_10725 [Paenibacillus sabinae T27]
MLKKLSDLFDVRYGHSLELNRLKQCGSEGIPFVSRKMNDNGISAYVELIDGVEPNPAGELTCALSGNGVLSTFIQERPYYTGFHVACLSPRSPMTKQELLYYCVCIKANRYRYNYGRQANRSLKDILIPAPEQIPDWVNTYDVNAFDTANLPVTKEIHVDLDKANWQWFELQDLFEIKKGKRLTKANMLEGETPFIGSIDKNNGVSRFVGQEAIHEGNTITVNYNGSVAESFYQPKPFWASDDVNVLYPKFTLTQHIAMFIITLIREEKYRYNYGRKWHMERMRTSKIKLPIDANGNPDFTLMDNYIKSLNYSSAIC